MPVTFSHPNNLLLPQQTRCAPQGWQHEVWRALGLDLHKRGSQVIPQHRALEY